MASTKIVLHFDEPATTMRPEDAAGSLQPLAPANAGQTPAVADGAVGGGRLFAVNKGFIASEAVVDATKLRRSMTIEAILKYTASAGIEQTIICRGKKTGTAAERRLWCLSIVDVAGVQKLRSAWDRSGGTAAVVPDLTFTPPAGFMYLAAVREWASATVATVSYYVNGLFVGSVTSAEANIEDGDAGTTQIGIRWNQGGAVYAFEYRDIIDELRVAEGTRSAEEIRQIARRLFVHPARQYEALKALMPPGNAYTTNPESFIQRELMVAGDGLGHAASKLAELDEDFLPDRAWSFLDRWEEVTRLAPRADDTIAQRRERVVGFLRKIHGYNRDEIRTAIFQLLRLTSTQVAISEVSNRFDDSFLTSPLGPAWHQEANEGTIGVSAGQLTLAVQAGDDARWTDSLRKAVNVRTPLVDADRCEIVADVASRSVPSNGDGVGLFVLDMLNSGWAHLFGIKRDAGVEKFFSATIGPSHVVTVYADAVPAGQLWLSFQRKAGGGNLCDLRYSTTGKYGPWTTVADDIATLVTPGSCGLFARAETQPAPSNVSLVLNEGSVWCPRARTPFHWYVYRDPGISGTPDIQGAQLVIAKMKPAHTLGTVVESLALKCDDADNLSDREPLGGA